MGRLFWKLFATLFFAQLVTIGGVGSLIWLHRVEQAHGIGAHARPAPPPDGPRDAWRGPGSGPGPGDAAPPGSAPPDAGHAPGGPPPGGPDAFAQGDSGPGELPTLPIVVGLVASLGCALLLAHYLSRPIVALRRAFGEVADGHFDVDLSGQMGRRRDELADLGRQFDLTAQQLKGLLAHQKRLLHDVSHELRSPLARIQLAIDLARQQPDRLPALIERVERESARIDHLIEELLTLSRLEAQSSITLEEEVDIVELVNGIVSDARFEAQSRRGTVELDAVPEAVVQGHAELLQRAIENVVRNAVRYTFEGTAVAVAVALERHAVRISVSDEGPGIPENALAAVFEPFVRLQKQQGPDGYGLGLAITQRIISGHRGTIRASNRDGGGLTITIVLPRARLRT